MDEKEWVKYLKDEKIIAIDPGKEGGIVVYSVDKKEVIEAVKMPETPQFVEMLLGKYKHNSICYLEKVGGIPGMGASAMFNFGKGYGYLEMALICKKIPTVSVTPQKWQKEMQLGVKGKMSTNQWKTKLMNRAQQLFPDITSRFNLKFKKDWLCISDSLLILEYARITEKI